MAVDAISYERLVEKALLCVVRDALEITRDNNALPGNHHFYISFKTKHDGVVLSERLLSAYPEDMTIVLQHEFSNLEVTPDAFSVTLSFSDVPERITVPFDAITSFADPHARFAVSFNAGVASDPPAVAGSAQAIRAAQSRKSAVRRCGMNNPSNRPRRAARNVKYWTRGGI